MERGAGWIIGFGLVAMWVTYLVTRSEGWAWGAFFIGSYVAWQSAVNTPRR